MKRIIVGIIPCLNIILLCGCSMGGDERYPSEYSDHGLQWREVEVPGFIDTPHITDTKIYRLRNTDHGFLFVFSRGNYLNLKEPRTSYVGHVDADDSITLTDLKDISKRNTSDWQPDSADPHIFVTDSSPQHSWVSWDCGADTHVCAIRSGDCGKTFDDETFSRISATGLFHTVHEPSITCNSERDCLLTWGETLLFDRFDLYVRRWTASGWCPNKQQIGRKIGLPLEMTLALGNHEYVISTSSSFEGSTLQSFELSCDECSCGDATDRVILDSGYDHYGRPAGGFHYEGASGNIAPREQLPGTPTWQIYSHDQELKALRRNVDGEIDSRVTFSDPDGQVSIMAGNIDFDGDRFYVFYHRFFGVNHPRHPNTYSVCYRFTPDQYSDIWGEETCPIENLAGLETTGSAFSNVIQPVGSAWKGQISIIFQKDCHDDRCSLALLRSD